MGRPARLAMQTGWHHVMNRGTAHGLVFHDDADRVEFGQCIATAHDRTGVRVLAYCLMDTHFHLIVNCPDGGLSAFAQHLIATYTRRTNQRHERDGPVFRGRFRSRIVADHEYLATAVRYVHRNPLDIDPRMRLDEYRWSSHRTYLGLRPTPRWLDVEQVLGWFDGPTDFHQFVTGD